MTGLFLTILNMSISAGWIVLAVVLVRLLLKKAPKWITVLLWVIVALRLVCPYFIESPVSLIPSVQTVSLQIATEPAPQINSGIPFVNQAVNPVISSSFTPNPETNMNPLQLWIPVLCIIWLVGVALMLLYTTFSYLRVKRKIDTAVLLRENIYQSEQVVSPFVLGFIKPKIYLPFNLKREGITYVIAHEQAHICRKDHWWKPLGFLLLTVHWFNPLLWLGYVLLCRDIELACDEKVIKDMDTQQKADYSQALLSCSVNRHMIAACPLAFGEVGLKNRVKSVLNYKKPAFWIIIGAIIVSLTVAVCFLTNPATNLTDPMSAFIEEEILSHHKGMYKSGEYQCTDFQVLGKEQSTDTTTVYMWVLYLEYDKIDGVVQDVSGAHIPTVITLKEHGNSYTLVEYWEPRDGTYYPEDIRSKFPWYLHSKALDSQRYINEQSARCNAAAQAYFSSCGQALTWEYLPMASFTRHNAFYFDFDFPYSRIEASCTSGEMWRPAAEGQPSGKAMTYEAGESVCWWPKEAVIEKIPDRADVILDIYHEDGTVGYCKLRFTCTARTDLGRATYQVSVVAADQYEMISMNNGGLICRRVPLENVIPKEPPALVVVACDQNIVAAKGSVSWLYQLEDGTTEAIMGDGLNPLDIYTTLPVVELVPSYQSASDPLSALLQFNVLGYSEVYPTSPATVTVRCWAKDQWYVTEPKSEDIATHTENGNWYFSLKADEYIYEVTATWNHPKYSGLASYRFRTTSPALTRYPVIDADSKVKEYYHITPTEQLDAAYDNEEFIITQPHAQLEDGLWVWQQYGYLYRLEISGRLNNAKKNTTYIILSNTKDITFDQAWKASGLSSNLNDYFSPETAVIVGHRLYD